MIEIKSYLRGFPCVRLTSKISRRFALYSKSRTMSAKTKVQMLQLTSNFTSKLTWYLWCMYIVLLGTCTNLCGTARCGTTGCLTNGCLTNGCGTTGCGYSWVWLQLSVDTTGWGYSWVRHNRARQNRARHNWVRIQLGAAATGCGYSWCGYSWVWLQLDAATAGYGYN
jgi:hypothetical protein